MNEPTGAFLSGILHPGTAGWIMTRHRVRRAVFETKSVGKSSSVVSGALFDGDQKPEVR